MVFLKENAIYYQSKIFGTALKWSWFWGGRVVELVVNQSFTVDILRYKTKCTHNESRIFCGSSILLLPHFIPINKTFKLLPQK